MRHIYRALFKLLESVKKEPRRNLKIKMLKEFPHQKELKKLMWLAYDVSVSFGISSKAFKAKRDGVVSEINPYIFENVLDLRGRNAKINYIENEISWLSKQARQYVLNVLDKDIGIGIGVKTINTALGDIVEDFKLMLAHKQTEERYVKNFSDVSWVYINEKIDGVRCYIKITQEGDIICKSRDGILMEDFLVDNIACEIKERINHFKGRELDCEIHSKHFQKLMRIYRRKNVDMDSIFIRKSTKLKIFDLIDKHDCTLVDRVKEMEKLDKKIGKLRNISFLKYHRVKNDYSGIGRIAAKIIKKGKEGIIVKHPFKKYQFKRSGFWLKFKNKDSIELKILDCYKGEANTVFENALGGFVLDLKGDLIKCGSGFTEEERNILWDLYCNNPDEIIGKVAEISFMEETKAGRLRHPVFERLRFDK